ncbi:thiamine pyrophosphate-dependent acetolactate synthase large subunit-like protein [Paraburkholderia youngii]
MMMHGIEIQTAARYRVKVIYVVLNNAAHGAIHIDAVGNGSISEQFTRLPNHDWTAFAASLGVTARHVQCLDDLDGALSEAMQHEGPFLIEVKTGVFPAPNRYYAQATTHGEAVELEFDVRRLTGDRADVGDDESCEIIV